MPYPLSTPVFAGDPTLATHYNNLRSDALHAGQAATDAVAMATMLERFESRLKIQRLDADRIRIPASAAEPVSMMINGFMVQAVANVDLAVGAKPSGAPYTWFIFANRADSSTTFTLSLSTSPTELANQRRIGRLYWDGSKIDKDSIRSELSLYIADLLYFVEPQTCEGRLTLSTGVSVTPADVSSSSLVYFTPHSGNRIALYVPGYGWRLYSFSELSVSVAAFAIDKNIDVFIYDNAGTLTLSLEEWSNNTLRAVSIVRQDGIYCKSGALNHRYLGTVRTNAAGTTCDTKDKRFLWNFYNRMLRPLYRHDPTPSWTYNVRAWRKFNQSSFNRLNFVIGVNETPVHVVFNGTSKAGSSSLHGVALGLDSDEPASPDSSWSTHAIAEVHFSVAVYHGFPGLGYHYIQMLETGSPTAATFYGTHTLTIELAKSCAHGSILC